VSSPRATRARSGRTLVRDPASRARARRRPSAFDARRAKNDDADARQRMTFENARRVSRVPSLARPSRARARVRAFRLRCRPNARQPKPARRSHARCATYECRPDACGEFSNALPEFCHAPRKSAVGNRRRNETLFMASGGEFCFLMCFLMRLLSIRAGSVPGWRRTPGASRPPHTS
jgi:hypothetical protein